MEQYAIKGGNPLVGEVEIGGAKNAALPILAASVMTDETVYIENMPDVRDTNVLLSAMENIGVIVKRTDRHKVTLNASNISELVVEDENIKKIRASYYLIGALLGKYKHAEVALPGGCDIGCRAIDQHIKGFRALGADVKIEHGLIKTQAEHLRGSHIYMDVVSVGATINIMMAAVMAEGQYQGCRYGCDPYQGCFPSAWHRVCRDSRSDRSRYVYVRSGSDQGRCDGEKCDSEAPGVYYGKTPGDWL